MKRDILNNLDRNYPEWQGFVATGEKEGIDENHICA